MGQGAGLRQIGWIEAIIPDQGLRPKDLWRTGIEKVFLAIRNGLLGVLAGQEILLPE